MTMIDGPDLRFSDDRLVGPETASRSLPATCWLCVAERFAAVMMRLSGIALIVGTVFTLVLWSQQGLLDFAVAPAPQARLLPTADPFNGDPGPRKPTDLLLAGATGDRGLSAAIATHDSERPPLTAAAKAQDRVFSRKVPHNLARVRTRLPDADIDPLIVGSIGPTEAEIRPPVSVETASDSAVFRGIEVIDGITFQADGLIIRLAGVALPAADAMCKLLNGKEQTCRERAATRLDLITRHRPVSCQYTSTRIGAEAIGHCRIGKRDLAGELTRGGWVSAIHSQADESRARFAGR